MNMEIDRIKKFPIEDGKITAVEWIKDVKVPEPNLLGICVVNPGGYYRVTMKLTPAPQSDITVVVCLPEPEIWNGKFLGTGNGGYAGKISEMNLMNGVSRGYATANTNLGTSPEPDDCIGREEVWKDFGYRATHLMTAAGKKLTAYFYGRKPQYAYFIGGSTGGQQGFSEAQRYPEDYDGIISLSPAFDRVRLHSFFVWNWQQIHKEKDARFTAKQAQEWKSAIVETYGKQCGSNENDLFLCYPDRIRENPMDNPFLLQTAADLLTEGQIKALHGIYEGPKDPLTGERIIAPFLPGTEAESLSLADLSDKEVFDHELLFPFRWLFGKEFDLMEFDFQKDLQVAIDRLSPILDADNPDLSAFKACGGKLLVIGGSSDAIIPYTGFLDYYEKVIERQGSLAETKKFFRFLLMPGFGHTVGGSGVQEVGLIGCSEVPRDPEHDVLCAMEQWVEHQTAPECLLGTHFKRTDTGLKFDHARPGYVYPYVTEFMGGDPKNPQNYRPVEDECLWP